MNERLQLALQGLYAAYDFRRTCLKQVDDAIATGAWRDAVEWLDKELDNLILVLEEEKCV